MLEEYIVSFTEGRVRLRHPALKDAALGQEISTFLLEMNGILSLEHKALTGSLLIYYDAEHITQEEIYILLEQGEQWLKENAPQVEAPSASVTVQVQKSGAMVWHSPYKPLTKAQKRKLIHASMISTFMATLISGGVGNKKAHYMAGGAFALLTFAHLWRMRKAIY